MLYSPVPSRSSFLSSRPLNPVRDMDCAFFVNSWELHVDSVCQQLLIIRLMICYLFYCGSTRVEHLKLHGAAAAAAGVAGRRRVGARVGRGVHAAAAAAGRPRDDDGRVAAGPRELPADGLTRSVGLHHASHASPSQTLAAATSNKFSTCQTRSSCIMLYANVKCCHFWRSDNLEFIKFCLTHP